MQPIGADAHAPALRVMMVEGSAVARQVLDQVLQLCFDRPVRVQACPDLDSLAHYPGPWHLVLVDIDQHTEKACEALRRLHARSWRVATTLYDDEDRLLLALRSGVHGYLLKQDRPERLVEVLQRIVQGLPDITPAMARGLLAFARRQLGITGLMTDALAALGRGASLRETARELGRSMPEIQAVVAEAYRIVAQSSSPAVAHRPAQTSP